MTKRLNDTELRYKPRSGQSADINAPSTTMTALPGELHYCEDTGTLWYYNAVTGTTVQLATV